MTWRPIETAPKDGTRILIAEEDKLISLGWWRVTPHGHRRGWMMCGDIKAYPTHWMPLPAPPCPDCDGTGTAGERAADGAPLVCTACQGGRRMTPEQQHRRQDVAAAMRDVFRRFCDDMARAQRAIEDAAVSLRAGDIDAATTRLRGASLTAKATREGRKP